MAEQDKEIWEKFIKGDKAAFEQLLLRYYRPLYEYGIRFQSDPDQLQDDLHDLMVNLWERRSYLKSTDFVKLYLFKALRHQIIKEKRKKEIFINADQINDDEIHNSDESIVQFEKEETDKTRKNLINHTLGKLTKRQHEILYLKFFEDLSNEEIADLMQISRPATANLLYTSLRAFKSYWKAEFSSQLLVFFLFIQKIYYQ